MQREERTNINELLYSSCLGILFTCRIFTIPFPSATVGDVAAYQLTFE